MASGSFLLIPPERARQFICVRRIIAVDVKVAKVNQVIDLGFKNYMQINVMNQPEIVQASLACCNTLGYIMYTKIFTTYLYGAASFFLPKPHRV